METTSKQCNICGVEKPLDAFYPRSARCAECICAAKRKPRNCAGCNRTYYHRGIAGNRRRTCDDCAAVGKQCGRCGAFKPYSDFYRRRGGGNHYCKVCALAQNREWRYGIAKGKAEEVLGAFGESCGACGRGDVQLVVDHCHKTGAIRGMLCGPCNSGMGLFRDDIDIMLGAVAYLKRHSTSTG